MINVKLSRITLSVVSVLMLISLATPASAKSVNDIIKAYYPIYNKAQQCQGIIAPSGPYNGLTGERKFTGYCIEIDRQREIETNKGKRLYVVVKGDASFNKDGEALEYTDTRFDNGLVGMFVLKPQGSSWQVESANPTMNAGSSGFGLSNWRLQKFAPNAWGFLNKHSNAIQGYYNDYLVILMPNGKGIKESWIGMDHNNEDVGKCEEDMSECDNVKTTFAIDRQKTVNGFYPLEITINGLVKGKKYNNTTYHIQYQKDKGYIPSKDYPLNHKY